MILRDVTVSRAALVFTFLTGLLVQMVCAAEFIFLPVPQSPLITLRVMIKTGPMHDPSGKEGLAWLMSSVVARGGTGTLSRADIIRRLFPMAADIRCSGGRETLVFDGTVHRDHLKAYYAVFKELVLQPAFDEQDLRRERDAAINWLTNGLRSTEDESLGKEVLELMLYRNHPYQCFGTVDGLLAIDRRDLIEFHRQALSRRKVWVGLAGGYDLGFAEQLKRDFALVGSDKPEPLLPSPVMPSGLEVTLVQKKCDACAISLGFPVSYTRADPDFFALMVANSFLGEHRMFIGRLQKTLRMARGMNYGNYSYLDYFLQGDGRFAQCGVPRRQQFFSIWIRPVKPEQAHFALRAALRELRQLVERGMTVDEVEDYKRFVLANSRLWAQTVERRLAYRMDSDFYGRTDFLRDIQRRVARLTAREVNAAIR
ncbi:MAG TPA: pitrilysin family protein, partial [Candidatus Ozemobacteraceae bacterium]|nr:pitrilysin family protein [Candidatus Ozemobacteraceae bacterium]